MAYWDEAAEDQSKLNIKADEALGRSESESPDGMPSPCLMAAKPEHEADVATCSGDADAPVTHRSHSTSK